MTIYTGVPVGSGLATQVVAADETTYGVAADLSSGTSSFEILNETMELKKTAVDGKGLAAGKVYYRTKRRVVTNYSASGDIKMDCPTRELGFFLRHMVGDFPSAPTEIGSTGIYSSVLNPTAGLQGHSFTLQKGVSTSDNATVEPFTYVGCKIPQWELSVATGGLAQLSLTIDARNELAGDGNGDPLNTSVPSLATFSTPTTGLGLSVFHFREATIYSGGTPTVSDGVVSLVGETALGYVRTASIQHQISFDNNRQFLGNSGFIAEPIEDNFRKISGSLTIEWLSSEAVYEAFSADTTTSLELKFTGPDVSTSNYLLDIIIPNIKFEGDSPKVRGPQIVTQNATFVGEDDEATTPIQITYQSEDSTY